MPNCRRPFRESDDRIFAIALDRSLPACAAAVRAVAALDCHPDVDMDGGLASAASSLAIFSHLLASWCSPEASIFRRRPGVSGMAKF